MKERWNEERVEEWRKRVAGGGIKNGMKSGLKMGRREWEESEGMIG